MLIEYRKVIGVVFLILLAVGCQSQNRNNAEPTPAQYLQSVEPMNTTSPTSPLMPMPTQTGEIFAPESSITSTQHGVTMTVTNLQITSTQTILDFAVQIDPLWGFTIGQYDIPPQQIFISDPPSLVDENGRIYQPIQYQGWDGDQSYVDAQTKKAYTGGRIIFEPVVGSHLDLALQLELLVVRNANPIQFTVTSPNQEQDLSINQSLTFGDLSTQIETAKWKNPGILELSVGKSQVDGLVLRCLYLYQDPTNIPGDYTGCSYQENEPADLVGTMSFGSLQNLSQPLDVWVAVNVVFSDPFQFSLIRSK